MADYTGAGESIPEGEEEFLVCARQWYKDDYGADKDNIRNAGDDIRFYAGDQWLNEDRVAREAQNRPVITEDHLAPAVRQITNDMRMNKPSGKVHPVDSAADLCPGIFVFPAGREVQVFILLLEQGMNDFTSSYIGLAFIAN